MYKLVLILKYLRRKLAPLFAALAVMLCTAMVIIVMSVMGGFLDVFRESAKNLTGDVVVEGGLQGFEGYEQLTADMLALPQVAVATPMIETFGLVNFGEDARPVRIQGVDFPALEQVVGYKKTLVWNPDELAQRIDPNKLPTRKPLRDAITRDHPADPPEQDAEAIIGIEVNPFHRRDENGQYDIAWAWAGRNIALTVVPLTAGGTFGNIEPERKRFVVTNELKSGLYDVDQQYVFIPFSTLQKMLKMDEREAFTQVDPQTGLGGEKFTIPGRANRIVLKAADGFTADQARDAVIPLLANFAEDNPYLITPRAFTWEEVHGQILGAVENEKGLVTFLFVIIGLVSIVMVATTFYMIVLEKTRDIGVLRAIGASRDGVIGMFLGYGLAIGLVGSLVGLGIAVAVVTNLNEIQSVIAMTTGWQMWNPQTYFFDKIPDRIDYVEAWSVVGGAVISSVIGAMLPALLAGRLKPVDALRYE